MYRIWQFNSKMSCHVTFHCQSTKSDFLVANSFSRNSMRFLGCHLTHLTTDKPQIFKTSLLNSVNQMFLTSKSNSYSPSLIATSWFESIQLMFPLVSISSSQKAIDANYAIPISNSAILRNQMNKLQDKTFSRKRSVRECSLQLNTNNYILLFIWQIIDLFIVVSHIIIDVVSRALYFFSLFYDLHCSLHGPIY